MGSEQDSIATHPLHLGLQELAAFLNIGFHLCDAAVKIAGTAVPPKAIQLQFGTDLALQAIQNGKESRGREVLVQRLAETIQETGAQRRFVEEAVSHSIPTRGTRELSRALK